MKKSNLLRTNLDKKKKEIMIFKKKEGKENTSKKDVITKAFS